MLEDKSNDPFMDEFIREREETLGLMGGMRWSYTCS